VQVYFFDTSALQHRYVPSEISPRVKRIISDQKRGTCYIADVTVLEISRALANRCRQSSWGANRFDAMHLKFLRDIESERLKIRTTTKSDILRAKHLLRFAGVLKRKKLHSADALIATCCLCLALEIKKRVVFYTHDWSLYLVLRDIVAFRTGLRLRYVGVPKGGIPAQT
jgi:predicted nucleic acid-binding protein